MSKELEYKLYLPKYSNVDKNNARQKISSKALEKYVKKLSQHFGGASVTPKIAGCYIDDYKKLVCDENIAISTNRTYANMNTIIAEATNKSDRKFIENMAEEAAVEFGQDSIMFVVSPHDAEFVDGPYLPTIKKGIVEKPNTVLNRLLQ
jgi:hypothetical protein